MHTTTAGLVQEGPYKSQIEHVERTLLTELEHPLGISCRTADDYWFAFLLRLDPWEIDYDLDQLDNPELFKKVNRSIGITVQPNWYKERLHAAWSSEDTRKEVLTKDFNIWQTEKTKKWAVTPDEIRKLQKPLIIGDMKIEHITDCLYSQGWSVFVGLDFSNGDDLFAVSMLGVNYSPGLEMCQRFFADTYLWVLESALEKSPNRAFFEKLIEQGWLRVCPGKVFNPDFAINELALYLDTHRQDREALELYRSYQKMYRACMEEYKRSHGPMTHMCVSDSESYDWLDDPWPWEISKNKEA